MLCSTQGDKAIHVECIRVALLYRRLFYERKGALSNDTKKTRRCDRRTRVASPPRPSVYKAGEAVDKVSALAAHFKQPNTARVYITLQTVAHCWGLPECTVWPT